MSKKFSSLAWISVATLTALTVTTAHADVTATSTSLGQYQSVACDSNPIFSQYSCNQCFQGGQVSDGDRVSGLFDNWINSSSSVVVAYKDEQKNPHMIPIGNSVWASTPADESQVWKNASDVTWTPSGDRQSYMLTANQTIRFWEADLGAGYTLTSSSQGNGDIVGLIQYPITYHAIDMSNGSEGAATPHYECTIFTYSKASTPTETPPAQPTPPPTVTQTETGPAETLLLIVAAFFIAFGLMFSLRKRS